jgi:hypothetical protein
MDEETKPNIIAKMTVQSVTQFNGGSASISLTAEYDPNLPEDTRFCKATPSAKYEIACTNPAVIERMTPGTKFYVEFREA